MKRLIVFVMAVLSTVSLVAQENHYVIAAKAQFEQKNYQGALILLNSALREDKGNTELLLYRAHTKVKIGDVFGGIKDINRVLKVSESKTYLYKIRGVAYMLAGKNVRAVGDFDKVLKENDVDAVALFYRGVANYKLGKTKDVCQDWSISSELGCVKSAEAIKRLCKQS